MKKNKLVKVLCSIVLCLMVGFAFMGCDINEVKEATTASIEASTNVISVTYDEDVAREILACALSNSLQQEGYKTVTSKFAYRNEALIGSGSFEGVCARRENSISYRFSNEASVCYYTKIGNNYYYMGPNGPEEKCYRQVDSLAFLPDLNSLALPMYTTLIPNVVNARYYQGAEHVYALFAQGELSTVYEFVIKDSLIAQINTNSYTNTPSSNYVFGTVSMDIEYGAQVIDDLPTSLDGYQEINN